MIRSYTLTRAHSPQLALIDLKANSTAWELRACVACSEDCLSNRGARDPESISQVLEDYTSNALVQGAGSAT